MGLPHQTEVLLETAQKLATMLPADAVLMLTETNLDVGHRAGKARRLPLLVAAQDGLLTESLKKQAGLTVIDIDPGPTPRANA